MWNNTRLFLNKKPNIQKLLQYGFINENGSYHYSINLMDDMFRLHIVVSDDITQYQVIDCATNEPYTLLHVNSPVGSFTADLRLQCEEHLTDLVEQCYEPNIFKSDHANLIIAYIKETYGANAEYLWESTPNNAIFRDAPSKKWYAALLTIEKRKIGIDEDGFIEIIDLKETPEHIASLVDHIHYLPGYHMNKKHWYTIKLDGSVPIEKIYQHIDTSYHLVVQNNRNNKRNAK